MTDSRTLLSEYAENGSEAAFRELVTRYLGLVYAAALRLVDGDAHLAQDVAQTVFIDLARKASGLSRDVMLGGWLHQRTFNVAAPMMRARRRREAREREAVTMNALNDDSNAALTQLAPVLDEAITQLGAEDRTAILLRFFEQSDFRSIGEALGTSDDAAQKRVTRALEKLQILLKRRGVALSATVLAMCLGSEALTAAPVGLAATISGAALAGTAAGGTALTILKVITMTKLKAAIIGTIAVASVATTVVIQQNAQSRLRAENESLRQQVAQLTQAADESAAAAKASAQSSNALSDQQLRELLRLRSEVGALRTQKNELEKLKTENRRLAAAQARVGTDEESPEDRAKKMQTLMAIAKMNDSKLLLLGMLMHAQDNPAGALTNLDQVSPYLKTGTPDAPSFTGTNGFDLLYQGSIFKIKNPGQVIVVREQQPWQGVDGSWFKAYGFADGHAELHKSPDGNFDEWERQHAPPVIAGQ